LAEQIGTNRRQRVTYLRALAVLTQARGDVAEAIGYLEEALGLAAAIGLPGEQWEIHALLAELHRRGGDLTAARLASAEAVRSVKALAARIEDERLRTAFLAAPPVRRVSEG
jgi:tetratricopeptide (TPR) repeat protein